MASVILEQHQQHNQSPQHTQHQQQQEEDDDDGAFYPPLHMSDDSALIDLLINKLIAACTSQALPPHKFTAQDSMTLYTKIFNILSGDKRFKDVHGKKFYGLFSQSVQKYIDLQLAAVIEETNGRIGLQEFLERWLEFRNLVKRMAHCFAYLERFFIPMNNLPKLDQVAMDCFNGRVLQRVKGYLQDAIANLIDHKRDGDKVDETFLRDLVNIFVEIDMKETVYKEGLEPIILQRANDYYSAKASVWLNDQNTNLYMSKVQQALETEKQFAAACLPQRSEEILIERVQQVLQTTLKKHDSKCSVMHMKAGPTQNVQTDWRTSN